MPKRCAASGLRRGAVGMRRCCGRCGYAGRPRRRPESIHLHPLRTQRAAALVDQRARAGLAQHRLTASSRLLALMRQRAGIQRSGLDSAPASQVGGRVIVAAHCPRGLEAGCAWRGSVGHGLQYHARGLRRGTHRYLLVLVFRKSAAIQRQAMRARSTHRWPARRSLEDRLSTGAPTGRACGS